MSGPHNLRAARTPDEIHAMLTRLAQAYVAALRAKGCALSSAEMVLTENAYACGFADGVKAEMMTAAAKK